MHLLDSDIATLLFYGRNTKVVERYNAFDRPDQLALSLITRAELLRGRLDSVLKAASPIEWLTAQERLRTAESWLTGFTVIGITDQAAENFSRLVTNRKLKKFGRADLMTACIALAHDATLVTRNRKDFQSIPDLRIENWAD